MNKLNITLKQHTPLIHFQHNQEGATLRASEVKPKLDRFILTKLGNGDYKLGTEEARQKGWLVGNGEHGALDYKMRIMSSSNDEYVIAARLSQIHSRLLDEKGVKYIAPAPYFAQEKEISELFESTAAPLIRDLENTYLSESKDQEAIKKLRERIELEKKKKQDKLVEDFEERIRQLSKKGLLAKKNECEIRCYSAGLWEVIKGGVQAFFITENFGTRQSKGFGCFMVTSINSKSVSTDEKTITATLQAEKNVSGIFFKKAQGNLQQKFVEINNLYTVLKRGQSHPNYTKSRLWEYMCASDSENPEEIRWEKWKIKQHLKQYDSRLFNSLKYDSETARQNRIADCQNVDNGMHVLYIRALLGLAENYEFAKQSKLRDKLKVSIVDTLTLDETTKKYAIDRFRSPIRFLITDNGIVLITYKIPELLFQWKNSEGASRTRLFRFTIEEMCRNNSFDLAIPSNFNLADFIEQNAGYGKNLKNSK